MKKIKIMYIPSQNEGGCYYYRCMLPMEQLKKQFPDKYDIFITNAVQAAWQHIKETDILIIHNCLYDNNIQLRIWNLIAEAKRIGVKTILDMDDYWDYGKEHPVYNMCMGESFPIKAMVNFNMFDCVTTTTQRLRGEIFKYNKNVHILENSLSQDNPQFSTRKNPCDRIRFGLTGGYSHVNDLKQLFSDNTSIIDHLPKEYLDKMQIVLCGFNIEGKKISIDENGNRKVDPIDVSEVWWTKLEKQITKDYSIVSPEYKEMLMRYDGSDADYDASNEPYRRIWSKSIVKPEYGRVYEDIDVLLVPLNDTFFNSMKSVVKLTEAGFTNTAVISSKVAPYTDYGRDMVNCIFVDNMTPSGWVRKIMELIDNEQLRLDITKNLHNKIVQEHNIEMVSRKRDKLYSKLIKK